MLETQLFVMPQKMKKQHRNILIYSIILLGVIFGAKKLTFDNENFLVSMAQGFDIPSKPYYFLTTRIFRLAETKNIEKTFEEHLKANTKPHLHDSYIYLLGIIGQNQSSEPIMKKYIEYQNEPNHRYTIHQVINHMGNSGNTFYSGVLEVLLKNYKNHNPLASQYEIARALYLVTGNSQEYIDEKNKKHKLAITEELETARNAIATSKGRRRTLEEMLLIDNVTRPPDWTYVPNNYKKNGITIR